jgi:hypothetical protein
MKSTMKTESCEIHKKGKLTSSKGIAFRILAQFELQVVLAQDKVGSFAAPKSVQTQSTVTSSSLLVLGDDLLFLFERETS